MEAWWYGPTLTMFAPPAIRDSLCSWDMLTVLQPSPIAKAWPHWASDANDWTNTQGQRFDSIRFGSENGVART